MLRSLSSDISRETTPAAADRGAPATVIDLRQPGRTFDATPLHITPELLAALAGSWSGRD